MDLNINNFLNDIDKFTDETEEYTRAIFDKHNKWQNINKAFEIYFSFLKSITKYGNSSVYTFCTFCQGQACPLYLGGWLLI